MARRTAVRSNLTLASGGRWTITTLRQELGIDFRSGAVELADVHGRFFPVIDDTRFRIRSVDALEVGSRAMFTMSIPRPGRHCMQHRFTTDVVTSIVAAPSARKDGRIHVDLSKVSRYPHTSSAASIEYRLGIDADQLEAMVARLQVLKLTTRIGTDIYPPFQVLETGELLPGLREVLYELADGTEDPWTWWLWLTSEPDWAGKRAVWELLREGGSDAVIRAAGRAAWAWRQ